MVFELPKLDYDYKALEPYIDAQTMEIHHTKHHGAYTAKLNDAIKGTELEGKSLEDIFKNISEHPAGVRNNGGGYYNHNLFWKILSPRSGEEPTGDLLNAINKSFGSFENFKNEFSTAAASVFGSGWAWLVKSNGELKATSTPNQDNPLMDVASVKGIPLMGLDVWEHAYYLKYQNRRPDYIAAFWNIVAWDEVAKRYLK
ncbi:MAG: superoxide dismutase [Bacteroidales bacterium]|nr:MAG: superoxide dismutase [Bacteroidales bacterium]